MESFRAVISKPCRQWLAGTKRFYGKWPQTSFTAWCVSVEKVNVSCLYLLTSVAKQAKTALSGPTMGKTPFVGDRRIMGNLSLRKHSANHLHHSYVTRHSFVSTWKRVRFAFLVSYGNGRARTLDRTVTIAILSNLIWAFLKGEVRRKMSFTYALGFVVLRDVVKVFPVSSSSFARKTTGRNRARSHSGAWRGLKTKWDLKMSLPSPTYLIRY